MFLKELEIVGFKSFPEKTTFKFDPGITAIVGPNGCGKSNIFDSIRWVLGEQSSKALRGVKMEDVIFNGTEGKPPLGMAEVTLFFSNASRKISLDCEEIEICRRIFRSGESQYFLNKAPVRLRDILELFMGTGIGAESYSLVEQGKIDLILSSRPEERRLIFDEASGITKFKAQKKEAARKLEDTEQNLLRIGDIISEVKREINSLERQANKARRYKEVLQELKQKEASLAVFEIKEISSAKQELETKTAAMAENISSCEGHLQEFQQDSAKRLEKIRALQEEISQRQEKISGIANLIQSNTQRNQMNQERISELNSRIQVLSGQLKEASIKIEVAQSDLESFQNDFFALKEDFQQKEQQFCDKEKQQEAFNFSIKSFQEKIRQLKSSIFDLAAAQTRIKNELIDLEALIKSQALRKKRLDIEIAQSSEEKSALEAQLSEKTAQLDELKAEFTRLSAEAKLIRRNRDTEGARQENLRKDIQNLENEKITRESQRDFLKELRLKYEEIGERLNAVLYLDKLPAGDISGIVVKVSQSAQRTEGEECLADGRLGYRLAGEAKPMPFDTAAIEQKIEQIQAQIQTKRQEEEELNLRIAGLNRAIEESVQKINAQEMLINGKNIQVENITEQLNKMNQEHAVMASELKELQEQIRVSSDKQIQLQQGLNQCQGEQAQREAEIASLEKSISEQHQLREANLIALTQLETEIKTQGLRLEQYQKTRDFLENACQQHEQLFRGYEEETAACRLKIKQLTQETEGLGINNQAAEEEKAKAGELLQSQQADYQRLTELQDEDSARVAAVNGKIDGLRKETYEFQMQAKELDFKEKSIRDRMRQVYKQELEDFPPAETSPDVGALREEIAGLSKKLDSYGAVNLIAIEEYDELKKRFDFLNQQQDDLIKAKDSLNEAITRINRTARRMFLETFEKIKEEFHNYFRLLFGGGEALVALSEENNILESGIEIICRPPGKKLQNVLALSGGEKALSAVALIFAVFKVKPAPFCVLDEIDAALDEANIGRFSRALQEFARDSQFLVITHNKKTIAGSDVMYGITMQEAGISRIVSVKFSETGVAV